MVKKVFSILMLKIVCFSFFSEQQHYDLLKRTSNLLPVLRRIFQLDRKGE